MYVCVCTYMYIHEHTCGTCTPVQVYCTCTVLYLRSKMHECSLAVSFVPLYPAYRSCFKEFRPPVFLTCSLVFNTCIYLLTMVFSKCFDLEQIWKNLCKNTKHSKPFHLFIVELNYDDTFILVCHQETCNVHPPSDKPFVFKKF